MTARSRAGGGAANAIARYLREQDIVPELVLCSPARRARETLERMEHALGGHAVRVEPELYGASPGALLEHLRGNPDAVGSVLLIGHNPRPAAARARAPPPSARLNELEAKYPTAALAMLVLPGPSWRELDRGTAELVGFVRPRDLEK